MSSRTTLIAVCVALLLIAAVMLAGCGSEQPPPKAAAVTAAPIETSIPVDPVPTVGPPAVLKWGQLGVADGTQIIISAPKKSGTRLAWTLTAKNITHDSTLSSITTTITVDGRRLPIGTSEDDPASEATLIPGQSAKYEEAADVPESTKVVTMQVYVNYGDLMATDRPYWSGPV